MSTKKAQQKRNKKVSQELAKSVPQEYSKSGAKVIQELYRLTVQNWTYKKEFLEFLEVLRAWDIHKYSQTKDYFRYRNSIKTVPKQ